MGAISTTLAIAKIVPQISEYLGLVEGLSSNVKKLLHEPFLSAKTNFEYARNAGNEVVLQHYIFEAMSNFIKATKLEENENLVSAYVGLALCQYWAGDVENAYSTANKIKDVHLSSAEKNMKIVQDIVLFEREFDGVISEDPASEILRFQPAVRGFRAIYQAGRRIVGQKGTREKIRFTTLSEYKSNAMSFIAEVLYDTSGIN